MYCICYIADSTYKLHTKGRAFISGHVMSEIGMAKAYNKLCLLIMNSSVYPFVKDSKNQTLPFDFSPHTTIEYSNENDKYIVTHIVYLEMVVYKKVYSMNQFQLQENINLIS